MFPSTPLQRRPAAPARAARAVVVAIIAAALLLIGASTADAAAGTIEVVDRGPTLGHDVGVRLPDGGWIWEDPGRSVIRVTPDEGASFQVAAWCVDTARDIAGGRPFPVDLQTPAEAPELAGAGFTQAAWLMTRADDLIAAADDPRLEAAAIQIAIWRLTGQADDAWNVTTDPALNARAHQLVGMTAGRTVTTSLALSGPEGALAVGQPAVVTVAGTGGAVADLAVVSGAATLSSGSVTLAGGSAQVTVTPSAPGEVRIRATAASGVLWRAAHLPGSDSPQDMAYVVPSAVAAETALAVQAAPPVTPTPPVAVAPVVTGRPAPVRAALRITKRAPRRVVAGRGIVYRITVTNRSRRIARGVVIRDRIPAGTLVGRLPARARLDRGAVVIRVGTLRPGASRTVRLWLRTRPGLDRIVRNVAVASASNARTVRARARTVVRPVRVAPIVAPAVTG